MTETLDYEKQYNSRASIPDHVEIAERWAMQAAAYREAAECELDIAYGESERTRFDLFHGDGGVGGKCIVVYIHGGYWRSRDRKVFSHVAGGFNARGISVAIPSYDLCPAVAIGDIIGQMQLFLVKLWEMTGRRPVVSGHSAGGHLTASLFATDWSRIDGAPDDLVGSAYAMSGIYDLRPLRNTSINEDLGLTRETAEQVSPLINGLARRGGEFVAAVGALESSEFRRQSREIAECWGEARAMTEYIEIPDANHLTLVDALTAPDSPITGRIAEMAGAQAEEGAS